MHTSVYNPAYDRKPTQVHLMAQQNTKNGKLRKLSGLSMQIQ